MQRWVSMVALGILFCETRADAMMLMEDELVPRPRFSERILGRGAGFFSARLLGGVGQDSVETLINEQTEKRIFAAMGLSVRAALPLSEKFRLDASASALRATAGTQVEENSGWQKNESHSEVYAQGQARFQLSDGVRGGVGATWIMRPAAQETFQFAGQSAMKKFEGYSFWTPEFSLSKETSGWSAGLGWRPRAQQSRKLSREGSDETVEIKEDVILDEMWSAGVYAQLANNRSFRLDVNLHGSNTSQTRDDTGVSGSTSSASSEDNVRRRYEVALIFGLGETGQHKLSLGGAYQSIGYTDQSNVTPQNIPLWSVLLRDEFKYTDLNLFVDALIGYGTDMQSLPDLNAKYKRIIISAQTGVQF